MFGPTPAAHGQFEICLSRAFQDTACPVPASYRRKILRALRAGMNRPAHTQLALASAGSIQRREVAVTPERRLDTLDGGRRY